MMEVRPTDKEIKDSLDRIAMTPDGRNLYIFLQRRIMTVTPAAKSGALRTDQGERSFAAKLTAMMAKGIAESVNRAGSSNNGSEQPVVLPVGQPVAVDRQRGASRRIGPNDRVAGWDRQPDGE